MSCSWTLAKLLIFFLYFSLFNEYLLWERLSTFTCHIVFIYQGSHCVGWLRKYFWCRCQAWCLQVLSFINEYGLKIISGFRINILHESVKNTSLSLLFCLLKLSGSSQLKRDEILVKVLSSAKALERWMGYFISSL